MINKQQLKDTLEHFPEEISLEELVDKIILLDKIQKAEGQSKRQETISEQELELEMAKWFK